MVYMKLACESGKVVALPLWMMMYVTWHLGNCFKVGTDFCSCQVVHAKQLSLVISMLLLG